MGPIARLARSTAEARAERREFGPSQRPQWDDLDGRGLASLRRARRWRVVRLGLCVAAVPVGWILAMHLNGTPAYLCLMLCLAGGLSTVVSVPLLVHAHQAVRALEYEERFAAGRPPDGR